MEDNPIWSKWSHNRHVSSKENSTTIDAKICQLGTDTRWHFGKCPLSNHNLQSDPLDMRPVGNRRSKSRTSPMSLDLDCIYKNTFQNELAQLLGWKIEYDGVDARTSRCPGPQSSFKSLSEPSGRVRTDLAVLSSANWSFLKFYQNIAGKQNDMFGIQIFICYENAHLGQSKYSDGKLRTVAHQLGLWRLTVRSLPGGIRTSRPKLRFPKIV